MHYNLNDNDRALVLKRLRAPGPDAKENATGDAVASSG